MAAVLHPGSITSHVSYITGIDGAVKPDAFMSREEAATVIYRVMVGTETGIAVTYPDVKPDRWSATAIAYVSEKKIMTGLPNGSFNPSGAITRAEFATILVRMMGYTPVETTSFSDCNHHWANSMIGAAVANGLFTGYPSGLFGANDKITRSQVMVTINRLQGRKPDKNFFLQHPRNPYNDLSASHWAYEQILEATITHDCSYTAGAEIWIEQ